MLTVSGHSVHGQLAPRQEPRGGRGWRNNAEFIVVEKKSREMVPEKKGPGTRHRVQVYPPRDTPKHPGMCFVNLLGFLNPVRLT